MRDTEICRKLLQLEEPWSVDRVKVDVETRELHAYLVAGKSWFGRPTFVRPKMRWRHANIGAFKTFVHATLPDDQAQRQNSPFLGEVDRDFTHGLAQRVVECLKAGLGYRQVCNLLEIDVYLAWQIRHAISEGQWGGDENLVERSMEPSSSRQIPPTGDPVWLRLLESEESIDIRLLGLRLLLARCRQEFPTLSSNDARIMRVNTVRRFFIKHEKQLAHEISQLLELRHGGPAGAES
ncbi:hypothetical protein QPM17_08690 [Marinobacter sp. TBZ242]|uniref:Uncharacterized protein n=1 Tax=Marinobacter azerbaijanicus TaxID=3050455 RepID=A0ABT7IBM7_9GAMM|nr:hypothetical protein [Marinobacter sp. TBZ242]MDL0431202.1 hypothetical protein [Marinobacter sp. TBZ242]